MFELKKYDWRIFKWKRKKLGLTQQEFANICGVSRRTIVHIENKGIKRPRTLYMYGSILQDLAIEAGLLDEFLKAERINERDDGIFYTLFSGKTE